MEAGYDPAGDRHLQFGGWIWRYDLVPIGSSDTGVTLTYDWSAVPEDPVVGGGDEPGAAMPV